WVLRVTKSFLGDRGLTYIEQGVILPSRVIQLVVKRPLNFYFHPGDYVYVQIPDITKYEWHPLTISSAPEQSDVIWLHIRAVGEWTNRLYNYFNMEATVKASLVNWPKVSQCLSQANREYRAEANGDKNKESVIESPIRRVKSLSAFGSTSSQTTRSLDSLYKNAKVMVLPVPVDCNEYGCGKEALNEKKRNDVEMAASPISKLSFQSLTRPSFLDKPHILTNAIILDKPLKVRLDGPYGSPSSHIFRTQHAILIATGIGVTPFASILQSIMLRYIEAKRWCPSCSHSWSDPIPPNVMKLRKVDFMWINRDQTSFEWFVNLLSELEKQQEEWHETDRFLDTHMHITQGSYRERRVSMPLDDREPNIESTTGLKWHKGRPDWHRFFKLMADKKKGRITVFFCGRSDLARSLRHICSQFGFQFRKEGGQVIPAVRVAFLLTLLLMNLVLFIWRSYEYRAFGWLVMLARANGQCLNFTCAIIIVCVCRKSITKLRSIGFSEYLPLDHYVYYHKLIGWAVVFYSLFHTVMHVINFKVLSKVTTISWFDFLFSTHLGIGWIGGAASLTGWILLALLVAMMVPAQPFMRRSGKFEVFYYSHLLYVPFYICLFIHAPSFWMWFLCPLIVFSIEWVLRVTKSFLGDRGLTYIEQGVILPSRVIQLVVKRPPNFYFHPGDYVYVQIPDITKYEWHPLTISSAPEQSDVIWLHIRAVGEWTNRLYNYFNMEATVKASLLNWPKVSLCLSQANREYRAEADGDKNKESAIESPIRRVKSLSAFGSTSSQTTRSLDSLYKNARVMVLPVPVDCNEYGCGKEALNEKKRSDVEMAASPISKLSFKSLTRPSILDEPNILTNAIILDKPLKVRLDGPYGSPSSHIFRTQHAILIATGIGVTPFASILQSIMLRYIEAKRWCPSCSHSWSDPIPPNVMKLRKVDFMWINRDQTSFEWFVNLLSELEKQQEEWHETDRFLDTHMHITQGSYRERRVSMPLDDREPNIESTTGLKWHKGRPDWHRFFKSMADKKKGRITVFFCGRSDLARSLRHICSQFGFQFRKEWIPFIQFNVINASINGVYTLKTDDSDGTQLANGSWNGLIGLLTRNDYKSEDNIKIWKRVLINKNISIIRSEEQYYERERMSLFSEGRIAMIEVMSDFNVLKYDYCKRNPNLKLYISDTTIINNYLALGFPLGTHLQLIDKINSDSKLIQ
ncbi:unnamed protein product, partial [Medioppia subpectinata]